MATLPPRGAYRPHIPSNTHGPSIITHMTTPYNLCVHADIVDFRITISIQNYGTEKVSQQAP